ncbi:nitrite reductase (NADH) small subunit [Streptomyces sp. Ag82_O1-12]|jgi:nitrite reductase (NADH) small subunit|uniref:nitrite reductase small subunit NirD n=1 Tax=Streptomyces TaxID=1883 RepID=UPI000BDAF89F|nr:MULTISPECIES: nitrite reductase small subunit NirD [unclassified Streptomyces]SMQ16137.1 nitrite reductase (NADH) small subunit [Streptomyces sp. Ag82_O1-12]SOD45166.1 nitrite reductase (NADH) small subunit [Streptomyces sp. Ag82_G6-1]
MTLALETTDLKIELALDDDWFTVCDLTALLPGRGVAALLPDGRQAAIFRDRSGDLFAIDNRDPFTGAAVLSRGLTGTHQGRPFVASPLLKQRFDLTSGECLDDETVRVTAYKVRTA